MAGKVVLTAESGPIAGSVFSFDEHDTFIFGRGPECHAQLPESDPSTSRHHFMLEVSPPLVRLRDLGSRNGTIVNGVKYGGKEAAPDAPLAVDLSDGDWIQVGRTRFTLRVQSPEVESASKEPSSFVMFRNDEKTSASPVPCASCGKNVAHELVGQNTKGSYYVCEACRGQTDPIAMLQRMAIEIARLRGTKPEPALPGYEIGKLLGKGGMGAVYSARRLTDGGEVALKVMLSRMAVEEAARKLFEREINVTRSLDHPNIVKLLEYGSVSSAFFFAMELCPGGSFASLLSDAGGKVPLAQAAPLMRGALDGLAHAHAQFFVHRDIKPGNILVTAKEGGIPKLSDFGLAKSFDTAGLSGITMVGNTAGTYCYMSKEQVTNFKWVKPVSDVWSMGAVFYQMLSGELPRHEDPRRNPLLAILDGEVTSLREHAPELPRKLTDVIDRALETRVAKRYQDAGEFRDALGAVL